MNSRQHDWVWLDARETVGIAELCHTCGMTAAELEELIEFGALVPLETSLEGHVFSAECVVPLRDAARLRSDFDLDLFTVSLLMRYLRRIEQLERRTRSLEAQLPGHARRAPGEDSDLAHQPRSGSTQTAGSRDAGS